MNRIARRRTLLVLGWFALSSLPTVVRAQGNVFNPYGNSGYADYREFAKPVYSNDPSLPGQARLQSQPLGERPRSNQFEQYLDRFDDMGSTATGTIPTRGTAPPGMPYYRSYRRYDQQYDRVYTPNNSRALNDRMKLRDEKYAEALKETDPTKRARLLRQAQGASLDQTTEPSSAARAKSGSPASAKVGRPRSPATPAPGSSTGAAPRASAGPVPYPRGYNPTQGRAAPRSKVPATRPNTAPAPASTPAPADGLPAVPTPR